MCVLLSKHEELTQYLRSLFIPSSGLEVFVAKTSGGSVRSSSGFDHNEFLQRKIGGCLQPTLETEERSSLLIKDDEENEELKQENKAEASKEEEEVVEECFCEEEKKLNNSVMEDLDGDGGGENCNIKDVEIENESEIGCLCVDEKKLANLVTVELECDGLDDGGGGENCNIKDENESEIGLLFEEEEEEEESMEMLSNEELNDKFEDFIRRMKEDIRMGR
ncbi:unnamed protein product [Fraxinus pennsylvanica]|uniref:Uncharacterized protein n=1 Tax=Fraxinus pennsylvanica TaxID=56036 RepID=A0AAD2AEX9_9LAMI|nr:unnamed protein product [Fraxinus pennsylvanica]